MKQFGRGWVITSVLSENVKIQTFPKLLHETEMSSHVPVYTMFVIAKPVSAAILTYAKETELLSTRMARHDNIMQKTCLGNNCIVLICT
jgi:hypothetical protein